MDQGYLKLTVLKILSKKQASGYALMQAVEQMLGKKPSPGSMYPLLKSLEYKKIIQPSQQGRKTIYSLTKEGKKHLHDLLSRRQEMAALMHHHLNYFEKICGKKQPGLGKMFQRLLQGKMPFGPYTHDLIILRDTVLHATEQQLSAASQKKIQYKIQRTTKEIQKLCNRS